MKRYVGELPSRPIDDSNHDSIVALLPEYVMMQVLAQQIPPEWRVLEQHFLHCPACHSEANMLLALMVDSYSGVLPATPTPAPPDLTFLDRVAPSPAHTARHAGSAGISVRTPRFQPLVIQFSLALLPRIRVQMAARTGGVRLHYAYEIPATDSASPTITVEVLVHDDQPAIGVVRVCVEYPHRDPFDQAGSQVTLLIDEQHWSVTTDQNGVAAFYNIPLDHIDHWQITVASPELDDTDP